MVKVAKKAKEIGNSIYRYKPGRWLLTRYLILLPILEKILSIAVHFVALAQKWSG